MQTMIQVMLIQIHIGSIGSITHDSFIIKTGFLISELWKFDETCGINEKEVDQPVEVWRFADTANQVVNGRGAS